MVKKVNLLGYWPEVVAKIKEYQEIAEAENEELGNLWDQIDIVMSDQYVESATERGVRRWEEKLGISPRATESLEDRKFRILSRFNEQLPYTVRSLHERLKALCGADGYTLEVDKVNYSVKVRIELTVRFQFEIVANLLEEIVPLNMLLDVEIRYNQHSMFSKFTHAQLSKYTHKQLRNEVIK